ncbi:MAG: hypothetical protein ACO1RA_03125 [Planctomycetaceae bacterium]
MRKQTIHSDAAKKPSLWRRCLQFRLRTLMLAMLVLPISLGWLASARSKSQQAWANVEEVKANCKYLFGIDRHSNDWWARVLGIDLPFIEGELDLYLKADIGEESQIDALKRLARLPNLKCLHLSDAIGGAKALEPLTQLSDLVELRLDSLRDTNTPPLLPSLPRLKKMEISVLWGQPNFTFFSAVPSLEALLLEVSLLNMESTHGLGALKNLKRLTIQAIGSEKRSAEWASTDPLLEEIGTLLELEDIRLSLNSMEGKIAALSKLKKVKRLSIFEYIADSDLAVLSDFLLLEHLEVHLASLTEEAKSSLQKMKYLKSLKLSTPLTLDGLEAVAKIPLLESLEVADDQSSADVLEPLIRNPRLKKFGIHSEAITAQHLEAISKITTLESLEIVVYGNPTNGMDELVKTLANLPKLQSLSIDNCPSLTIAGLQGLAAIPTLKKIWIEGSQVTSAEVDNMKVGRPDLEVELEILRDDNWW